MNENMFLYLFPHIGVVFGILLKLSVVFLQICDVNNLDVNSKYLNMICK